MKLLAKTAEERYQTAAGLEADLRHCLDELVERRETSGGGPGRSLGADPPGASTSPEPSHLPIPGR